MTIETANRLYELRKRMGLSQEELAEKLGVSRQAVSKWERSEASPDTDNLIALAKIYGMSLDELVFGEERKTPDADKEPSDAEDPKDEVTSDAEDPKDEETVINTDNGTRVQIGPKGIFVESDDGDKVQIDLSGIKITDGKHIHINCDDDEDDDDDDDVLLESNKTVWHKFPYPIACVIAYLLFGSLNICGGWALSWIVFTTIPIYYSLVDAIYKRRFSSFAYPVFTTTFYLFMGLYLHNWHPSWIIFITVPIYYWLAHAIDKKIKRSNANIKIESDFTEKQAK